MVRSLADRTFQPRFDAQLWHKEESDTDFARHGGDAESHAYGEVSFEGMSFAPKLRSDSSAQR